MFYFIVIFTLFVHPFANAETFDDQMTLEGEQIRVCYFQNWVVWTMPLLNANQQNIFEYGFDPSLCTHINYGFGAFGPGPNYEAKMYDEWADPQAYEALNNIKAQHPHLKSMWAVGGWMWNDCSQTDYATTGVNTCHLFSELVASEQGSRNHARSVIQFLRQHGFDGYDLDWEYPAVAGRNGVDGAERPQDKANFIRFIRILREEFEAEAAATGNTMLLLSAAVGVGKANVEVAYDIPQMNEYLDWIGLMTYDLHGYWDGVTGFNAGLYSDTGDVEQYGYDMSVSWAVDYWLSHGASADKLLLGLAPYGRGFTLASNSPNQGALSPTTGASGPGPQTVEAGYISYLEVVDMIKAGATEHYDEVRECPYIIFGDQWFGYDNERSLRVKVDFLKNKGLRGIIAWAIELDDFRNMEYPLLNTIKDAMAGYRDEETTSTTTVETSTTTAAEASTTTAAETSTTTADETSTTTAVETSTTTTIDVTPNLELDGDQIRVCYFQNWVVWTMPILNANQQNIFEYGFDPSLCTHINYGFGAFGPGPNYEAKMYDEWADPQAYEALNNIKAQHPHLKSMWAVGGWMWNDCSQTDYATTGVNTCHLFSELVASEQGSRNHARSVIQFLRQHGFDGYDLDWEYPAVAGRNGVDGAERPQDKANFIRFIRICREEFEAEAAATGNTMLLLSAAVGVGKANVEVAYDIPQMNEHLDWIGLMTYDLHGYWDGVTGFNAGLYSGPGDVEQYGYDMSVSWAVDYWISHGASPNKLLIGLAPYGRGFTLASSSPNQGALTPAIGASNLGPQTVEPGYISYLEVVDMIKAGATEHYDEVRECPYIISGDQWFGYDNERSLRVKVDFLKSKGLRGMIAWAIELDDFRNMEYPLLNTIKDAMRGYRVDGYIAPSSSPTYFGETFSPTPLPTSMPTSSPTLSPTPIPGSCVPCQPGDLGCTRPNEATQAWCDSQCANRVNDNACLIDFCFCAPEEPCGTSNGVECVSTTTTTTAPIDGCVPCTANDDGCTRPGEATQAWCDGSCAEGVNSPHCPAAYCTCGAKSKSTTSTTTMSTTIISSSAPSASPILLTTSTQDSSSSPSNTPTASPETSKPTTSTQVSSSPSNTPTALPETSKPTTSTQDSSSSPSNTPTASPETSKPTATLSTKVPTTEATLPTASPTVNPTTDSPTMRPTTDSPTVNPTTNPSTAPSVSPSAVAPTAPSATPSIQSISSITTVSETKNNDGTMTIVLGAAIFIAVAVVGAVAYYLCLRGKKTSGSDYCVSVWNHNKTTKSAKPKLSSYDVELNDLWGESSYGVKYL